VVYQEVTQVESEENSTKVREEVSTTNHNITDNVSTEKKYVCQYCGAEFTRSIDLARHIKYKHPKHASKKAKDTHKAQNKTQADTQSTSKDTQADTQPPGTPHPPMEERLIRSPKEELEEWFISELEKNLPLFVAKDKIEPIVKTLRQYPDIIWDPNRLRYHILQISPKAHDYLLDWTLTGLYKELQELKTKFEKRFGHMLPPINPPQDLGMGHPGFTPPRRYREELPFGEEITRQYGGGVTGGQGPSLQDYLLRDLINRLLDKLEDKESEKQREPLVEIPNPWGAGTMKIPVSQAPTYLMIKSVQDQISALRKAIEGQKPKEEGSEEPKEPTVKIQTEDGKEVELPASQAVYYVQVMHEKERAKMLEQRLEKLEGQIQQMYQNVAPERVVNAFERLGYYKNPSPTVELINKTRQDFNRMLDRILGMMELQMKRQIPPNLPQLQYRESLLTPGERKKKTEEIKKTIKKIEEVEGTKEDIKKEVKKIVRPLEAK